MSSARDEKVALEKAREQLGREHSALHGLVETLRTRATTPREAHGLLSELHKALAKHFAHETYAGGFYEGIRAAKSELAGDLRGLEDEHFQLLATTQALRERAERGEPVDEAFGAEVGALLARLERHEKRELELVDRALG